MNLLGWGFTRAFGPGADILQQAVLPVGSHSDCSRRNGPFASVDERSMLCAGGQGTSGGCRVREVDTREYQVLDTLLIDRASFNGVLKDVQDCFGLVLPRDVIDPKNLPQFLNESDSKPKPIATW